MSRPLVCAHRGASLSLPDNSVAAFAAAVEFGADVIETDVRLSRDGVLVLAHDDWDIVPGVARLSDLLRLARGRIGLQLEIAEPGYEAQLVDALASWTDPLVITSIHPGVLQEIHRQSPQLSTGYVHENFYEGDPFDIGEQCHATVTLVEHDLVDPALLARAVAEGRPLWAWTVNDRERLAELFAAPGITGVITDDPALARSVRDDVVGTDVTSPS